MVRRIVWFYKCVAYYHFRWQIKVKGAPTVGAAGATTVFPFMNLLSICLVIEHYWHDSLIFPNISSTIVVAFVGLMFVVDYRYLSTNNRMEKIRKEFENVPKHVEKKRIALVMVYTIGSLLFMPVVFAPRVFGAIVIIVLVCLTPLLIILSIVGVVKKRKKDKESNVADR